MQQGSSKQTTKHTRPRQPLLQYGCRVVLMLSLLLVFKTGFAQAPDTLTQLFNNHPTALTVRHILVSGNHQTRRAIILRELTVVPGSRLPLDSTAEQVTKWNQLRLINTALFTDVQVSIDTLSADSADLRVQVRERWYIWPEVSISLADRNLNVWINEMGADWRRVNARVSLSHQNFRGNRENLSLTGQVGYTQAAAISYRRPYVDKRQQHGIGAALQYSRNRETYFATDSNKLRFLRADTGYIFSRYQGEVSWSYRPGYVSTHLLVLRLSRSIADQKLVAENPDFFGNGRSSLSMAELQYRVDANHTDYWPYPMAGTKMVTMVTGRLINHSTPGWQAQARTELGIYHRLWWRFYGSGILRARVSFPEVQPYFLRQAMGTGSEYVRGYEYYVVDGSHYGLGRLDLKLEALNHTFRNIPLRYLPVLQLRLYPKVFADAGWVKNLQPGNSFLNNRWLYTWGAGVDVVTAYDFRVRVEYAVNALGQRNWFVHIDAE